MKKFGPNAQHAVESSVALPKSSSLEYDLQVLDGRKQNKQQPVFLPHLFFPRGQILKALCGLSTVSTTFGNFKEGHAFRCNE
jgi:hypothetical protein